MTPLTQEQLQQVSFKANKQIKTLLTFPSPQALQHLLRTDTEFVSKLHRAYIDSINKKVH